MAEVIQTMRISATFPASELFLIAKFFVYVMKDRQIREIIGNMVLQADVLIISWEITE